MRIIFTGSRNWTNSDLIYPVFDAMDHARVEVVHGDAKGLDSMVQNIAELYGHDPIRVPADWDQYGKAAGPMRNARMAEIADLVIAFRSHGVSRGTDNMIANAVLANVPVLVCANNALKWQKLAHELWHYNYHQTERNSRWSRKQQLALRTVLEPVTDPRHLTYHVSRELAYKYKRAGEAE